MLFFFISDTKIPYKDMKASIEEIAQVQHENSNHLTQNSVNKISP